MSDIDTKTFSIPVRDNLVLRFIQPDEAEALFALVDKNRAYLQRRMNWVYHCKSSADSLSAINRRLQEYADAEGFELGVHQNGTLIGTMGFIRISQRNKSGEIGYWLSEEFQGRGIMADCVRALMNYGFNKLKLHRIEIKCGPTNLKSAAVPERLGFTFEGTARESYFLYDHFEDSKIYSMLASEWKSRNTA